MPTLQSGYAYRYDGQSVFLSDDELWEIDLVTPDGSEVYLGHRMIDGTCCNAWRKGLVYWAQVKLG